MRRSSNSREFELRAGMGVTHPEVWDGDASVALASLTVRARAADGLIVNHDRITMTVAAITQTVMPLRSMAVVADVAAWLWPRRRLMVAELRAVHARMRAPEPMKSNSRRLRFAV